jgi:hypothetical protein
MVTSKIDESTEIPTQHVAATQPADSSIGATNRLLKNAQKQVVFLGFLWILLGFILLGFTGLLTIATSAESNENSWTTAHTIGAAASIIWLVLGLLAALRITLAVYIGLLASYLLLIIYGVQLQLFPVLFLFASVLQSHYVITLIKKLRNDRVTLQTKPKF